MTIDNDNDDNNDVDDDDDNHKWQSISLPLIPLSPQCTFYQRSERGGDGKSFGDEH